MLRNCLRKSNQKLPWLDLTWLDLTWLDLTWLDLTWLDFLSWHSMKATEISIILLLLMLDSCCKNEIFRIIDSQIKVCLSFLPCCMPWHAMESIKSKMSYSQNQKCHILKNQTNHHSITFYPSFILRTSLNDELQY
jgi:hypothetical protein